MADKKELLELVERATSPVLRQVDWQYVMDVCDYVNTYQNGPQEVAPLIVDRLNGSEKVANYALTLLEACVENCGSSFHNTIGRFKFLNELIRRVSKKHGYYDTPDSIKNRILGMFYKWHKELRQAKIDEAFFMLERQGHNFPKNGGGGGDGNALGQDFLRRDTKRDSFDEKEKNMMLGKLLQSKDPEDLAAANLLIKEMVTSENIIDQDDDKIKNDLDIVRENIKVFMDLLHVYKESDGPLKDHDMIQELRQGLLTMRPKLARLCGDLDDDEDVEGVLDVNDRLQRALIRYNDMIDGRVEIPKGSSTNFSNNNPTNSSSYTADSSLNNEADTTLIDLFGSEPAENSSIKNNSNFGIDSDINALMTLNLGPNDNTNSNNMNNMNNNMGMGMGMGMGMNNAMMNMGNPNMGMANPNLGMANPNTGMANSNMGMGNTNMGMANTNMGMANMGNSMTNDDTNFMNQPPSKNLPSVTFLEKNGVSLSMVCEDPKQAANPNVLNATVSIINKTPYTLENVEFLAAVPKTMKVKLQPPSGTTLSCSDPVNGPGTITQIMMIANPTKVAVRVRFKFNYNLNGQRVEENGEASQFPQMI